MTDSTPLVVIDRDPLACRVRWHDHCVVETLSDGSKRHVTDEPIHGDDLPRPDDEPNVPMAGDTW